MLRADSYHVNVVEKHQSFSQLSDIISVWMQMAVEASHKGQTFSLAASLRVVPLIDCLINGLCESYLNLKTPKNQASEQLNLEIVTWT